MPVSVELHWFKFINTSRGNAEKHTVQTQREFCLEREDAGANTQEREHPDPEAEGHLWKIQRAPNNC